MMAFVATIDAVHTIEPPCPRAMRRFTASRTHRKVPRRLTRMILSQSSTDSSWMRLSGSATPAFESIPSMAPKRASIPANAAATCASSPTSAMKATAPQLRSTSAALSAFQSMIATFAPRARNSSAVARPIPLAPR